MTQYATRDRGSKVITQYVETAQTTSSTTAKVITFNPTYVKGTVNEPYAVEGALFFDASGTTHDLTLSFDAGAGKLLLEGVMISPTAATFAGGDNLLTASANTMLIDNSVVTSTGGVMVKLSGTWIPSLRDSVSLTITSGGSDTYTINAGSWLKFTRLSD